MSDLYPDVPAWQAGPGPDVEPSLVEAVEASETVVAGRDETRAGDLYAALAPRSDAAPAWCGSVGRVLGLLAAVAGRDGDAERHLADAFEANTRLGYREWAAYTRYEVGRLLLRRDAADERVRGARLLDRALASAKRLGMRDLARRVLDLV